MLIVGHTVAPTVKSHPTFGVFSPEKFDVFTVAYKEVVSQI